MTDPGISAKPTRMKFKYRYPDISPAIIKRPWYINEQLIQQNEHVTNRTTMGILLKTSFSDSLLLFES